MRKSNHWKILGVFLIGTIANSFASTDSQIGWYFYEQPPVFAIESQPDPLAGKSSSEIMAQVQKEYAEVRDKAILEPTQENIAAFREATQLVMSRSSKFAMLAATQGWQDPNSPIAQQAVMGDGLSSDLNSRYDRIKDIYKNYNFVYFYSQDDCKYCNAMANELNGIALENGTRIIPISMDGSYLATLPKPIVDKDGSFAKALDVKSPGALVLYAPDTKDHVVIGYGFMTKSQINDRISSLFISGTAKPNQYLNSNQPIRFN